MRMVLQRASRADVVVNGDAEHPREIGPGLVVLVGFTTGDDEKTADYLAEKLVNLRIFSDDAGDMNRSLLEVKGELLVVSQFTLYANCRKGRRPSFVEAARPEQAIPLYGHFLEKLRGLGVTFKTGEFGADMQVSLTNDGPVTIVLDSEEIMPRR